MVKPVIIEESLAETISALMDAGMEMGALLAGSSPEIFTGRPDHLQKLRRAPYLFN
jgi:hypothetical protein